MEIPTKYIPLIIAVIAAIFFLPFLGGVHLFDWDEINFAEIAREMIAVGDWSKTQIDYQPFYEKPPLFVWFQAISMKLFGVGEYAARFPNAICGMVTLITLYLCGKKVYNATFGVFWAGIYFASILPFFYFKTGIIDPWFNYFIFLGIWFFIDFTESKSWKKMLLAGLFTGLAVMTKGPVGFLIPCLTYFVFWVSQRFRMYVSIPAFLVYCLATFATAGFWYLIEFSINGADFIVAFFEYQVELFSTESAGHGGFFGYHFVVLLIGCFPGSLLKLGAYQKLEETDQRNRLKKWMFYLFWVVIILFTIVESKIVHYSSMCYFPITFLGAWTLYHYKKGDIKVAAWIKVLFFILGSLLAILCLALPYVGQNIEILVPLVEQDINALGAILAPVNWSWIAAVPGIAMILFLIYVYKNFSNKSSKQFVTAFMLMGIFSFLALVSYIKRAEGHSQRAVIEFCEQFQGKDVLVYALKHHSYAHLFYSRKQPQKTIQIDATLNNPPEKPTYYFVKEGNVEDLKEDAQKLKELYRKGGFVFYQLKTSIEQ